MGVLYVILVIFGLVSWLTDLYIKGVNIAGNVYDWYPGRLYNIVPLLLFLFMFYGLYALVDNYRNQNKATQNQIKYLFLGVLISFCIGLIANIIMPLYEIRQFIYVGLLGTIVFTASSAFVITKHHLLDISVVISRTVAELLTIIFLGLIYVGLVLLYKNYITDSIDIAFVAWTIIYGVLIGQIHNKIRLFMQTTSDKVFLRGKYDYYKELAEISSKITRTLSIENIIRTLQKAFYEVIEVANPRIYLQADYEKPEVEPYRSITEPTFRGEELILPCMLENKQNAIIVLGEKLSEDPYTEEDLKLLGALANQTAVAIDCQRMYEEMLKAQEQLLIADKLTLLGGIAANLAKEIKPSLLKLKKITIMDDHYEEKLTKNKQLIINETDNINRLIESILTPIRKIK